MNILKRIELLLLTAMLPAELYRSPKHRLTKRQKHLSAHYFSLLYVNDPSNEVLSLILRYFMSRAEQDGCYSSLAFRGAEQELTEFLADVHRLSGQQC